MVPRCVGLALPHVFDHVLRCPAMMMPYRVHIGDLLHNIPERIYANVGSAASRPEGSFR